MVCTPCWGYDGGDGSFRLSPDADPLCHAVEKIEIIEAEGLKGDAVAVAHADFLTGQVEPGQQEVIKLGLICMIEADRQRHISLVARGVKADAPAMPTVIHWLAARQHQTDAQLVIDVEQIGLRARFKSY